VIRVIAQEDLKDMEQLLLRKSDGDILAEMKALQEGGE